MNKNSWILYIGILVFGLVAPFIFPAFKVQLSILCVLILVYRRFKLSRKREYLK